MWVQTVLWPEPPSSWMGRATQEAHSALAPGNKNVRRVWGWRKWKGCKLPSSSTGSLLRQGGDHLLGPTTPAFQRHSQGTHSSDQQSRGQGRGVAWRCSTQESQESQESRVSRKRVGENPRAAAAQEAGRGWEGGCRVFPLFHQADLSSSLQGKDPNPSGLRKGGNH
jgi:hypothetical protein